MSMTKGWLPGVLLLLLAAPRAGRADRWSFKADALTDVPVQVGGRIGVEGPLRLQLGTSLGMLPGPYVDLINEVVVAAGGYDESTAELIRQSLKQSLVWRLHLGWRPFEDYGFYFEFGYGLVTLGGGVETEELIAAVTGSPPPRDDPTAERTYDVTSTLHMLDVEIGWQWRLWEGLTLRAAVGFAGTLGAHSEVAPAYRPVAQRAVGAFTRAAEKYLDDIYTTYVFTPVASLALGYRF